MICKHIDLRLSKGLWNKAYKEKKKLGLSWDKYFEFLFFGKEGNKNVKWN